MNTEIEYLKSIAIEITAKPNNENNAPDKHLFAHAHRIQKIAIDHLLAIDNFPQREIFYYNTLGRLVEIGDMLFNVSNSVSPDVRVILDLLTEIKKVMPSEISPNLQLPKAFLSLQSEPVMKRCRDQVDLFKLQGIEPQLITIAAIPFKQFAQPKHKLYWRNYTWLKGYEEKLNIIDWENADCNSPTEALVSVLLNCDFNDDRFFIYCKKYIVERTGRFGTKRRRLAEFAECEKLILQDTLDGFPSYNHRRPNIGTKLTEWIKLETKGIRENDVFNEDECKIEFNLDSDSIAIFWKHLLDHGVTKAASVDTYAKQIAATCFSKGRKELAWETIKGKFYGRSPKYLKRIFDPLVAIIADIRRFLNP